MKVKLETFLQEISEKTTVNDQYPVLTSSKSGIYLQNDYFNKQVASKDNTGYKIIKKGQFTYRAMSDTGEFYPNMLECTDIGIVSPAYPVFEIADEDVIVPEYLKYFFKSDVFQYSIASFVQGSTRTSVKFGKLKTISIELPEKEKQCRIVKILKTTQRIIDRRKVELQQLDDLVKARFVEMFDMQKCKRKTLGECTDFVDYRGHTPELSDTGTVRMVNAKSVGKGFFRYVEEYVTEETYDSWMHRGFGYPGDILFVTEGHTFGNNCLIPNDLQKFALGQRVITIKGHQELLNAFLCSYMQTDMFWKDINVYRTGGTAQGIRSKDLVKVHVPIPPLKQQRQFATFVEQIDKSKFVVQKALDEAQTLFDSLMQEYFG